ncbi:hypothetical protein LQW54_008537 [Pestalotiopsis sp. IQ-011]
MASEDSSAPAPEAHMMEPDDDSDMEMETEIAPSRCAYLTRPQTTIVDINERGDIVLLVGEFKCQIKANGDHVHTKAVGFRVCSSTLARASPVMKAMLFGNFREATQTTITLPEDDPKAMELLLSLVHGDTDRVYKFGEPWKKNRDVSDEYVDEIYQIVALADKYIMTRDLRPFASDWCDALIEWEEYSLPSNLANHHKRLEKLMAVAYQFGHLNLFQMVYVSLNWYSRRGQELFQNVLEPDGVAGNALVITSRSLNKRLTVFIIDHLRSGRIRALNETLLPVRNMVNALMAGMDPAGLYLCKLRDRNARLECQAQTLDAAIRNLRLESLWPLPNAEDVIETTQSFSLRLAGCLWDGYDPHNNCSTQKMLTHQFEKAEEHGRCQGSIPSRQVLISMLQRAKEFHLDYFQMFDDKGVDDILWARFGGDSDAE